jgi:hypothetical protein
MTDDEKRKQMLRWHSAIMYWTLLVGEDLPEWASKIRGVDATAKDALRLNREANGRWLYGTAPPDAIPVGILDFIPSHD